jgi:uncharacterized protein (TIGR00255 family)
MNGDEMKLASMTGFGRARGEISDRLAASLVVRSVNHKFLDIVVRTNLREELPELEAAVRSAIGAGVERGRVTVQVDFERTAPQPVRAVVNIDAVSSVVSQLGELRSATGIGGDIVLADVLAIPGLVVIETGTVRPEAGEAEGLAALTSAALTEMNAMRRTEAVALVRQIRTDIAAVTAFLDWFEPRVGDFRRAHLERLRARVAELLDARPPVEPERLAQEAALLADRADVAEELVRLRSHLEVFERRLQDGGAVGRALDFMCQEVLRELNTLGSKCRELGVTDGLVDAKAALERVREQVQNLE